MSLKDNLGTRMKENYENRAKTYLIRRMPVAIRLDMKAGHTFTRGFKRPFDYIFMDSMQQTMKYLCENIQGCLIGYTQSDEITLILQDYKTLSTDAWFDYAVQKVCSISASMATMQFNKVFSKLVSNYCEKTEEAWNTPNEEKVYLEALLKAADKGAMFDSRCFNIPKEEVTNLLLWRQKDAQRNSVNMVGQANFSHKELQGKDVLDVKQMLLEKGIDYENFSTSEKTGTCCIKDNQGWQIDRNIPIFVNEGRKYIEELINCEEE